MADRVTVGEYTYVVAKVPARVGLRAATRLANAIAPIFRENGSVDLKVALAGLLAQPDLGDHIDALCDAFSPYTQVLHEGKTATLNTMFDQHFAANYGALLQWLVCAVEYNLSSFFAGLPGLAEKVEAGLAPTDSPSPKAVRRNG